MKNNRLPLYVLFVLVAVALVWRVSNPPPKTMPGPVGPFNGWKSSRAIGEMGAQNVNPAGTLWAGAWNEKETSKDTSDSAVRIVDFNAYSAKSCRLPDNIEVNFLNWVDDKTIRVCFTSSAPDKGLGMLLVDAVEAQVKGKPEYFPEIARVVYWPNATSTFIAQTTGEPESVAAFVVDGEKSCKMIGKPIPTGVSKQISLHKDAGISADGRWFMFSVSDPAAEGGRVYYLANAEDGIAQKAFDLNNVPGRIDGIWPSEIGVLLVCSVNQKLQAAIYDIATNKITARPNGVGDLDAWPAVPKSISITAYDGGFEFDTATGKSRAVLDFTKLNSESDKAIRDLIRDSHFYKLKSGNFITISETGGAIDIRELKPDGRWYRNVLPRI